MTLRIGQKVAAVERPGVFRVMSYNIRIAPHIEDDHTCNAWRYRLPKILLILQQYQPDIVGLQEASVMQIKALSQCTYAKSYTFLSCPPSPARQEVGLAIMYNTEVCELISPLYVEWFKMPPEGVYDGSGQDRCILYAKFRRKDAGTVWWFMTTHFDHGGPAIRAASAAILMKVAAACDAPVIITGDFNCFPQARGAELYEFLAFSQPQITDSALRAQRVVGVTGSWMGWDYDQYRDRTKTFRYDHIFISKNASVFQYGALDDQIWDAALGLDLYPSDHRPVIIDMRWEVV